MLYTVQIGVKNRFQRQNSKTNETEEAKSFLQIIVFRSNEVAVRSWH
jgi:hypothetical protein